MSDDAPTMLSTPEQPVSKKPAPVSEKPFSSQQQSSELFSGATGSRLFAMAQEYHDEAASDADDESDEEEEEEETSDAEEDSDADEEELTSEELLAAGKEFFAHKDYDGALEYLEQIKDPDVPVLMVILACYYALFEQGCLEPPDYRDMVEYSTRVLDHDPRAKKLQRVRAHFYRGCANAQLSQAHQTSEETRDELIAEALVDLKAAIALDEKKVLEPIIAIELKKVLKKDFQRVKEDKRAFYKAGAARRKEERRKISGKKAFNPHMMKH